MRKKQKPTSSSDKKQVIELRRKLQQPADVAAAIEQTVAAGSDDLAWRLEPGSDLVVQLHMLPTGKPEPLRPEVGLFFSDSPPETLPFILSLENWSIDIPPGVADYELVDEMTLPVPVRVFGLYPHAHYLGKLLECF